MNYPLPRRELLHQAQVQALLATIQTMSQVIMHTSISRGDEDGPQKTEGSIAAESTMIAACERLDKILISDTRWDITDEQLPPPHIRLKATLCKFGEGWLAFYGDINYLDKSLIGYGDTPQLALKCFDSMYYGTAPAELVEWLRQQTTTNENMDSDGNSNPNDTQSGGEILPGDSSADGQKPEIG
jgi:hypothetical protein